MFWKFKVVEYNKILEWFFYVLYMRLMKMVIVSEVGQELGLFYYKFGMYMFSMSVCKCGGMDE